MRWDMPAARGCASALGWWTATGAMFVLVIKQVCKSGTERM